MTEQITLLDVCKLPDVQIHSKTALFKYLVGRETAQMLKLRENIVKLSYTNKIIGVKGDQVGIISKRLPLRFKEVKPEGEKQPTNDVYLADSGYISHRNFYVHPLPTVRKTQSQTKLKPNRIQPKNNNVKIETNIDKLNILNIETQSDFKEATPAPKSFRSRAQSMARLNIYHKRETSQDFNIKRKPLSNLKYPEGSLKSFSNLLKDLETNSGNKNLVIPLMHEENTLFKRYQRLSQKQGRKQSSAESDYQNLMIDMG